MVRNGYVEREEEAARHAGGMLPSYPESQGAQPCPCGSGHANADCHGVRRVDYMMPAPADRELPQVATHGILASDPGAYSSGLATRCHACGAVLTVGLGFGGEAVVLVCDCGARNASPHNGPAVAADR